MFAAGKSVYASVGAAPVYVEDVFSPYLYDGNYTARTITNNIDLLNKGGLVWSKSRDAGGGSHFLTDTARGAGYYLITNVTNGQAYSAATVGGFSTTGYTLGLDANINWYQKYISWTFRKQAKFFDVVTWTGNGSVRTIAHSLGSDPGCIIIKRTDTAGTDWVVGHRSLYSGLWAGFIALNLSIGQQFENGAFNSTAPTSSVFTVGTGNGTYCDVNTNGGTYVAYLFAHNAGGFGLTGSDNVISCGSFTTDGSGNATVNLGYEPQWVLAKASGIAQDWRLVNNMTWNFSDTRANILVPNNTAAEVDSNFYTGRPSATGFSCSGAASQPHIYIAIRRGPMKVPTTGTSVFIPTLNVSTNPIFVSNFPVDSQWIGGKTNNDLWYQADRLRGANYLQSTTTAGESPNSVYKFDYQNGAINSFGGTTSAYIGYSFRRAPSFFDEVCFTPSAYTDLIYHNLGVAPEMIIAKNRGATIGQWYIHHTGMGASEEIYFNANAKNAGSAWTRTSTYWNNSSALFPLGEAHVAYLFASCPGVSKVGSYTGNGSGQTINCGFTGGARFVLIKRTDSSGDWYVWDTARGIVSGNDPYLSLNTTAAEVTTDDTIDPDSTGFIVNQLAATNVNVTSATYIFLAIA